MIISVEIFNFQSHKHTLVNLVKGVNVIIGPSDAGKSALFRAINWVRSNRPLGDAYRSEWGGDTRVILKTDDQQSIERVRTDKLNLYIVNGETLKAFGTEPPEEVFKALRIDLYSVQTQDDPAFLLAMSPGEAAQVLNKAASIDVIDRVIKGLNKGYRKLGQSLSLRDEQMKGYEAELERYQGLDDIQIQMSNVETIHDDVIIFTNKNAHMKSLYFRYKMLNKQLRPYKKVDKTVEEAANTLSIYDKLDKDNTKQTRNVILYNQYRALSKELQALSKLDEAVVLVNKLDTSYQFYNNVVKNKKALNRFIDTYETLEDNLEDIDMELEELRIEYNKLAPEECPLCGGVLPKEELA